MGATPSTAQPDHSSQSLLIDEHGNIKQPPRNPRPPSRGIQLQDARTARFASISDLADARQASSSSSYDVASAIQAVLPLFDYKSVVGVLGYIQILMFFASCWMLPPRYFYTANSATNWKFGSSDYIMERCAFEIGGKFVMELRRFVTPVFLHLNLLHLISNLSVQVCLGPRMLASYGTKVYVILFLLTGACGNMLSDAFHIAGVGASTSGMGLTGAFAAQVWLIWDSIDSTYRDWLHNLLILAVLIMIVYETITPFFVPINHYGHLGGLLSGFALAVVLTREPPLPLIPTSVPALPNNLSKRRHCCGLAFLVLVGACLCKIFVIDSAPLVSLQSNGTLIEMNGTQAFQAFCEQHWAKYSA